MSCSGYGHVWTTAGTVQHREGDRCDCGGATWGAVIQPCPNPEPCAQHPRVYPAPADAPRWTAEEVEYRAHQLSAGFISQEAMDMLRAYATSLAAAPSGGARLESAWQPMETAPKDGTPMLVFDEGAICLAAWSDGF